MRPSPTGLFRPRRYVADDACKPPASENNSPPSQMPGHSLRGSSIPSASPSWCSTRDLRVIAASRSFYSAFKVSPEETQGRLLYALGDGQWDIPGLRVLLEKIIPEKGVMEGYEVEHEFPGIGQRTMCLNARQVFYEGGANTTILLGIEDVTERRVLEREKDELLRQKDVLLEELQHRVANSLQIIASIILMKARRCSRKRRVFICKTRTSGSCRSLPCRNSSMHPGPLGPSKLRLISQSCAGPLRPR